MKRYEFEVAAYAAAHKIYNGLPQPDRASPGGYRSAMVDQIAETIMQALSVHLGSAYPEPGEPGASPEAANVRKGHGSPTVYVANREEWAGLSPTVYVANRDEFWAGLRPISGENARQYAGLAQTRYWRELRHAYDDGGAGNREHTCLKCGMPDFFGNHFSTDGEPLQGAEQLRVE